MAQDHESLESAFQGDGDGGKMNAGALGQPVDQVEGNEHTGSCPSWRPLSGH